MNYHRHFRASRPPVETCVVGTGGFGRSFLAQGLRVPMMRARISIDRDAEVAAEGLRSVGVEARRIRICATAAEVSAAWAAGDYIAAADLAIAMDLPFEVLIEATGAPEAGARHCRLAIEAGRHVALVSKEVDSVIGPGLGHAARARGCVVTPVDGDQPSLLIALITWAELLGFDIIAAGKSSEYDFVFDAASGQLTSNARTIDAPELRALWDRGDRSPAELVAARSQAACALPQRPVPDLCEMQIVMNATDIAPDRPDFHAPLARIPEVPDILATSADGGLLSGERRADVFHCLRAPDEVSFAGGVFVIVRCDDREAWQLLAEKGHVVSRDGRNAMLYLPRHLLGLEAATSVLEAAMHGVSSGGEEPRPRYDLVARAERDLAAGSILDMGGHHHTIDGVSAELHPATPLAGENAAPFYLAANARLVRDVASGAVITAADIELSHAPELTTLRRDQDAVFVRAPIT
jgi:predicted homoserine dehydrogenase-like protein